MSNTYIITLTYTVSQPPVNQIGGQFNPINQHQPAVAIITADSFSVDAYGVSFSNKLDIVAFFPTGQYRSITKNG